MRLLGALDVNKAVGVDAISAKLLRMAAPGISASLASLFNHSLECGQILQVEVSECITPVQKGEVVWTLVIPGQCQYSQL